MSRMALAARGKKSGRLGLISRKAELELRRRRKRASFMASGEVMRVVGFNGLVGRFSQFPVDMYGEKPGERYFQIRWWN